MSLAAAEHVTVEVRGSVDAVDTGEWDALAAADVFSSRGWLRTCEETALGGGHPRYFLARESGRLVAAATCHLEEPTAGVAAIERVAFGRFASWARPLGLAVAPVLRCGSRTGVGDHVLVCAQLALQTRVRLTRALVEAMDEVARSEARTLCFRNVPGDSEMLEQVLRERGSITAAEMPTTFLDVTWSSFGDYVRALKVEHRATAKNIPREINRARRAGIEFRTLAEPTGLESELHALLDDHYRRLNGGPFPFSPAFLPTLARRLPGRIVLHVAFAAGRPIAVVVGIRSERTVYLPMVGVSAAASRESFVYFNNSYNEPIRSAIESGVRRLYCGKLLYDVKVRRGFRLMPLRFHVLVHDSMRRMLLPPILAAQSRRLGKVVARQCAREC